MGKRRRKKDSMHSETKTVGYGYVGRFADGQLGWGLPDLLLGRNWSTEDVGMFGAECAEDDDRAVLCRITVEQVFSSTRRPITRRMRKKVPQ